MKINKNSIFQGLLNGALLGIGMIIIFTFWECTSPEDFVPSGIPDGVEMMDIPDITEGRGGSKDFTIEIERKGEVTGEDNFLLKLNSPI